jgi:hypothetical protein
MRKYKSKIAAAVHGLDPAIHPFRKKMDAWVKPAHDGGEQRLSSSGSR